MDFGSIKNVGTTAVDEIVKQRQENGEFKDFSDFCERIQNSQVNKKCIESLIKAGAFEGLGQNRKTLMASFEGIIDTIADASKKSFDGQVSMFDLGGEGLQTQNIKEMKYHYTVLPEYTQKELLSMEKEMLGLYISGHPLEHLRAQIEAKVTINTYLLRQLSTKNSEEDGQEEQQVQMQEEFRDGQTVLYAGIITSIKKKYTKNNTMMAFVTVEDLYGQAEIIVFESCYKDCSNLLMNENIVLVEGRLSLREDEEPKIVAKQIKEFVEEKKKVFELDITSLEEPIKQRLRGAIRFFAGDKNNISLQIKNGNKIDQAGGIYMTPEILLQFQEIVGSENAKLLEI